MNQSHDTMNGSCQEPRTAPACHYTDNNGHQDGQSLAGNHEGHDDHASYDDNYDDEAQSMIAQHGSCESFFSEDSSTQDPGQWLPTALKDDTADESPQQTPTGAPYPLKKGQKNVAEKIIDMVENILRVKSGGEDGPSSSDQRG
ncbi:hypothetical protein ACRE_016170 [Hapsidospora chrysogenum ATCC 11550]|uniref:Uncharacterized protein n=1 Tax=Hapsidospora chrysogenum (strain ATCC 11550 / CBS 779.69 / DSM 880 / IAM 14645 / JCM 23072 / IMI 49137) TaxID=857340 RepID=A0A086TDW3_HAPC1|nr:hypothetical protein ACRE_016170 [Hapsidospora chrysogenum ATCC 11550]